MGELDLRADRQFEFRQLDLELAFAEQHEVLEVMEAAVASAFEAVGRTAPPRPFPQLTYDDAMARFGSDKPDLRFGMEIQDATEVTRGSEFGVFASAPAVRYIVAPKAFSRAELSRLEELAKEWGAKGLAYLVHDESGEVRSPIAKFLSERELAAFASEPGSTALFGAGPETAVARVLGLLRLHLGRELELIDAGKDLFHWVVGFPLFAVVELRTSDPLLDLRLFRHLNFLASNLSQVIAGMVELGLGFLLPFFLLLVIGVDPAVAGIALIPATIPIILAGPLAGRLFDARGGRLPLTAGFLVLSVSGAALALRHSRRLRPAHR